MCNLFLFRLIVGPFCLNFPSLHYSLVTYVWSYSTTSVLRFTVNMKKKICHMFWALYYYMCSVHDEENCCHMNLQLLSVKLYDVYQASCVLNRISMFYVPKGIFSCVFHSRVMQHASSLKLHVCGFLIKNICVSNLLD